MTISRCAIVAAMIVRLFATGLVVNFAWEMAQMQLYEPSGGWLADSIQCLSASIGDAAMVLMIYSSGAVVRQRIDWFARPGVAGYAAMLIVGGLLAAAFELNALRAGRWVYTASMPRVPFVPELGLLPILQMLLLPAIIFKLSTIGHDLPVRQLFGVIGGNRPPRAAFPRRSSRATGSG